ncbi:hypothetical protein RFI_20561 [Reticulomyxa filosa]|uniref:Uncharacterized protein n=1 Tax=Reticulomyxa filosa TaxID=46433 RepID=X6MSY7_RETFI|nr:hypothetical protein RFI_20561 [Reticulomyxa filosa]|eukprot:ETO16776.1 hypothetical protein RFI_20561 [Reticulomyxa filosa]
MSTPLSEKEAREGKEGEENQDFFFSFSSCYAKAWLSLTIDLQTLDNITCYKIYLAGEECLKEYLKQNNGKCPIKQHAYCEFSKNKFLRNFVSELLVICPRQFDIKGDINWNLNNSCNNKIKIKNLIDHLDKYCKLITFKQTNELNELNELKNTIKDLQLQIEKKDKQINELKMELSKKKIKIVKIYFLLLNENTQIMKLKNNEWNNYNFGIFLLGENIILTVDNNKEKFGYLKIRTKKLLKQIHFGSGGGDYFEKEKDINQNKNIGGSGGQQLINYGSIQSNGGNGSSCSNGGGSGESILIELQCNSQHNHYQNMLEQYFGNITCIGGNQYSINKGGEGIIAIYGIILSSNDI